MGKNKPDCCKAHDTRGTKDIKNTEDMPYTKITTISVNCKLSQIFLLIVWQIYLL